MVKYFKPFGLQQEYEMNMHGVWEGVKVIQSSRRIFIQFVHLFLDCRDACSEEGSAQADADSWRLQGGRMKRKGDRG